MANLSYILVSGLLISMVSMTGVALLRVHPRIALFVEKNLLGLGALSAGIFLVTSGVLINETIEVLSPKSALASFAMGIVLYLFLHHFLSPHRHKGINHRHPHNEKRYGLKIIVGDALHNIADGLLLVASFGVGHTVGIANAVSIAIHEVPQEISEFLVLRKSGFTNIEAAYRNFASALFIFVGIALGLFLVQTSAIQAHLLGITATFFLGIVVTDLFPIKKLIQSKQFFKMLVVLLVGMSFMVLVRQGLGHGHSHETSINEAQEHQH